MNKIYIRLKNCYGISKFENTFIFGISENKGHLIYAPNGCMKTSFANTFSDIVDEKNTQDYFYPDRNTERIVKYTEENGDDVPKEDILVIQPYSEKFHSENVSVLLANAELKEEYEYIHKEIANKMQAVYSVLNKLSGKRESEKILVNDFGMKEKEIYDCLEQIYLENKDRDIADYTEIKYGKLVTADAEKILADSSVVRQLDEYIEQYEKLLTNSTIFKKTFNHNNAEDVLTTLDKDGFFKANHQVLLSDTDNAIGKKEFEEAIDAEKTRILDHELSKEFQAIDKKLASKAGTKTLREFIFEHKELIPQLVKFNELKKLLWVSYLFSQRNIFEESILNYQNNRKKLESVVKRAKEQTYKWNDVVIQFNERFNNMPYRLVIENKDDVVLKSEMPSVTFKYRNRGDETNVEEKELILHLSNGEKKALYLLNIIFEIEARKELGRKTLLIIDDIADSFDYRNKYAIIEYLKEIVENDLFMPIILTHNFDFYRTVAGRVGIKKTSKFVEKKKDEIILWDGEYFENVFKTWKKRVYNENVVLISSISFIRNIVEYTKGNNDIDYLNLTSLLHYKKRCINGIMATEDISVSDLVKCYFRNWGTPIEKYDENGNDRVFDIINNLAEDIVQNITDPIHIENKIVLSIAIRLKAEIYMIARVNNQLKVDMIKGDQTRGLRRMISFDRTSEVDSKIEEIIERVLIITSENIHINSFMYEPIVDMSLDELKRLYLDVKNNLINR